MTTDLDRLNRYAEVADNLKDALEYVRAERDHLLSRHRGNGATLSTLANATGLTVARVHQITGEVGE